jgi:hypothetical protein
MGLPKGTKLPSRARDLTGQTFNRWVVTGRADNETFRRPNGKLHVIAMWQCRCECGKERAVRAQTLVRNTSKSCGCLAREQTKLRRGDMQKAAIVVRRANYIQRLMGQRFGRLTVTCATEETGGHTNMVCHCDCGKDRVVAARRLISGRTKSCGCMVGEARRARPRVRKHCRCFEPPAFACCRCGAMDHGEQCPGGKMCEAPARNAKRPKRIAVERRRPTPNLDAMKAQDPKAIRRDAEGRRIMNPRHFAMAGKKHRQKGKGGGFWKGPDWERRERRRLAEIALAVTGQHAREQIQGPEWWGYEDDCPFRDNVDPEEATS